MERISRRKRNLFEGRTVKYLVSIYEESDTINQLVTDARIHSCY